MSSIDLKRERIYRIIDFKKVLKAERGIYRSSQTIYLWMKNGVESVNGVVKLERVTLCGAWHTSIEAFDRFVEAQS